jgi:glycosyltransferase involved in cell wall biosynthesis
MKKNYELKDKKNQLKEVKLLLKDKKLQNQVETFNDQQVKKIFELRKILHISLVMLVKNQESRINEVIRRIKTLNLDEYHIIDTGSTDKTLEIVSKMDDIQIHEISCLEDFSYMRNKSANLVNTNWILAMDSDELLNTQNFNIKLLIATLLELTPDDFSISFEQHSTEDSSYGIPVRIYNPNINEYFGLVHEEIRRKSDGSPVNTILTRVSIDNAGRSKQEINKFSKEKRYTRLLIKMIEIEPKNSRWFVHLSGIGISTLVNEGKYEKLLMNYLFKDGVYKLEAKSIKFDSYTRILIERYASYLIVHKQFLKAEELTKFGLILYPNDIYLMFYETLSQIEQIKLKKKELLKKNLDRYLKLDKQLSYDFNFTGTQLLELILAELNYIINVNLKLPTFAHLRVDKNAQS